MEFHCTIDPGLVSPAEKEQIIKGYDKGVVIRRTTHIMLGIDDAAADPDCLQKGQPESLVRLFDAGQVDPG